MAKLPNNTIWSDRKRNFFGLPWTFTKYILTDEKFLIVKGFLRQREEEVRLYRIMDLSLKRSIFQILFRIGTINLCTADQSVEHFDIKNIRNVREVKEMLSNQVEKQRVARGVTVREEITNPLDHQHDRKEAAVNRVVDRRVSNSLGKGALLAFFGIIALLAGLIFVKVPEAEASSYWGKMIGHYALLFVGGLLVVFGLFYLLKAARIRVKSDKR